MLSVIVTIVDGGTTLERCLSAIAAQRGGPILEVLVPWDDSVVGMDAIMERFPEFRFLALGEIGTRREKSGPAGQHELFDRRRAAGLREATGDLIAILEDRGVPRPDWAAEVQRLHWELPHAVIGGAVENGRNRLLNWAVYICDFGRYQLPYEPGPREYVTDVNICYKRRAIEATRELWLERYHETTVHWALLRAGETLYLSNTFAVDQMRENLTLMRLLKERVGWGRLFAYTRAREIDPRRRLVLAALSPLLPLVLFVRHFRQRVEKHRSVGDFLMASPVILLLLAGWSLGEMTGYLSGRP
ncbi:MAG: glycosyltransferase [Gemmatimonadales bacterium]